MIRLTRLRNDNVLFLNPDHIERLDHHHDTVVHLFNGTEYVVTQTPEEIVDLVVMQRARILAVASRLAEEIDHTRSTAPRSTDPRITESQISESQAER